MWRVVYYALLIAVGVAAAATPYAASVSLDAIVGFTILSLTVYLGWLLVWLHRLWPQPPLAFIKQSWRGNFAKVADRTALFVSSNLFFTWLPPIKATFPSRYGFWADPYLANFDRALLGRDAWRVTHSILGPLTPAIDYLYNLWIVIIVVISLGVALFASERRLAQFYLGIAVSWTLLGIVLAGALSSAGPIFGPDLNFGFSDLREHLNGARLTLAAHDMLWSYYTTGALRIGGGISAAPSIHCALTFVFCLTAYRSRLFGAALAYSAFIWIGSVHLGWHYFADGLLSLVGVLILWPLVLGLAVPSRESRSHVTTAT